MVKQSIYSAFRFCPCLQIWENIISKMSEHFGPRFWRNLDNLWRSSWIRIYELGIMLWFNSLSTKVSSYCIVLDKEGSFRGAVNAEGELLSSLMDIRLPNRDEILDVLTSLTHQVFYPMVEVELTSFREHLLRTAGISRKSSGGRGKQCRGWIHSRALTADLHEKIDEVQLYVDNMVMELCRGLVEELEFELTERTRVGSHK